MRVLLTLLPETQIELCPLEPQLLTQILDLPNHDPEHVPGLNSSFLLLFILLNLLDQLAELILSLGKIELHLPMILIRNDRQLSVILYEYPGLQHMFCNKTPIGLDHVQKMASTAHILHLDLPKLYLLPADREHKEVMTVLD